MKQKITKLVFVFAAMLIASVFLTSCNNASKETPPASTDAPSAKQDSTVAPMPQSGNDSMMNGNTKPTPEKPAPTP